MRERLEHIKETEGADLNEDDIQLLQQLESVDLEEEVRPVFSNLFDVKMGF